MTHHVQFQPYQPRGGTNGEPDPAEPAGRPVSGAGSAAIEHHVSAIVQRILNHFQRVNGSFGALVRSPGALPASPDGKPRRQPGDAPPASRVTAVTYGNADPD
jgi:hypothetical protein